MAPTLENYGKFKSGKRIKAQFSAADIMRLKELSLYLGVSNHEVIRRGVYMLHEFCGFEKSLGQMRERLERGF